MMVLKNMSSSYFPLMTFKISPHALQTQHQSEKCQELWHLSPQGHLLVPNFQQTLFGFVFWQLPWLFEWTKQPHFQFEHCQHFLLHSCPPFVLVVLLEQNGGLFWPTTPFSFLANQFQHLGQLFRCIIGFSYSCGLNSS
jgi:hypothetical protein